MATTSFVVVVLRCAKNISAPPSILIPRNYTLCNENVSKQIHTNKNLLHVSNTTYFLRFPCTHKQNVRHWLGEFLGQVRPVSPPRFGPAKYYYLCEGICYDCSGPLDGVAPLRVYNSGRWAPLPWLEIFRGITMYMLFMLTFELGFEDVDSIYNKLEL